MKNMFSVKSLFTLTLFLPCALAGAQRFAPYFKKGVFSPHHPLSTEQYDKILRGIGGGLCLFGGGSLGSVGGLLTGITFIRAGNLPSPRTDEEIRARHNLVFRFISGGTLGGIYLSTKALGLLPQTGAATLAAGATLIAFYACNRDPQKSCL